MKNIRRIHWSTLLATLFLVIVAFTPFAQATNAGVYPVASKPGGLTIGQWTAKSWQWALSIPTSINPLLNTTSTFCGVSQSGPVWFLAGGGSGSITRSCTIPSNKSILIPIIAAECSTIEGFLPPLSECTKFIVDLVDTHSLVAVVDGVKLTGLTDYRFQSSGFNITLPSDNIDGILGCPCTSPSATDGYWIMLEPLTAGTHTVHAEAAIPSFSFFKEVTYTLTIVED